MISAYGGKADQTYAEIIVTTAGLSTVQVDSASILRLTGGGSDVTAGAISAPTAKAKYLHVVGMGNGIVTVPNDIAHNVNFSQPHVFDKGSRAIWEWIYEDDLWYEVSYWP